MVAFDSRLKSKCVKTIPQNAATTLTSPLPVGSFKHGNESSTNIMLTPLNKQTQILIKTDTSRPRRIGLNVNTNVSLKPKKRYCMRLINDLFIFILAVYGVLSYFEIRRLKDEVQGMKLQLTLLEDSTKLNFEIMRNVINTIEGHIQENIKSREKRETSEHLTMKRDSGDVGELGARPNCSGELGARPNCSSNSNTRVARAVTRGPHAVHLRGALPEISVRDGGIIAPWYIDKSSSGNFLLADGIVGEMTGMLKVVEEGLYYIYAQIYYLTSSALNSYAINIQLGEGRYREDIVVSMCSAEAATTQLSELSCFTATVRYLRRGDRLYITQRERNRKIIFRDNKSFLGLVLLNSHHTVNNN